MPIWTGPHSEPHLSSPTRTSPASQQNSRGADQGDENPPTLETDILPVSEDTKRCSFSSRPKCSQLLETPASSEDSQGKPPHPASTCARLKSHGDPVGTSSVPGQPSLAPWRAFRWWFGRQLRGTEHQHRSASSLGSASSIVATSLFFRDFARTPSPGVLVWLQTRNTSELRKCSSLSV